MSMQLPSLFLQRMQRLLGDEYADFVAAYDNPSRAGLRVNSLKISSEQFRALAPFDLQSIPGIANAFLIADDERPGKHPYHAAGLYYLQEPSAMVVAAMLAPQPGERVLDLSAAPGGKATHLAALMQNQGVLVANEIHPTRVWNLAENLERCGVRNVIVTNETPDRLAKVFPGFFDRVLVDAPCSGEGMFRKSEAARNEWSPALVEGCATRQTVILDHAARMVREGGWLAYSTCTFAPEENEGTIARFLSAHPEFELVELPHLEGFSTGRPDWIENNNLRLARAIRLFPHRGTWEGHFVTVMRRNETRPSRSPRPGRFEKIPARLAQLYQSFFREQLQIPIDGERLALVGSHLYQIPNDAPNLDGLRVIHPGWWLGTIKNNRFEPAHALALGLNSQDARHVENFGADDVRVLEYLRGNVLRIDGDTSRGWVLMTVDGFPLGWGKRVQETIKNHYPRGLRWV